MKEAWLCHATWWCWVYLSSLLNKEGIGGLSERVWSATTTRGWWFTAKLAHYFGMIWALSAGREGLSHPPSHSLAMDGCLSLCVRVCVCKQACMRTCTHMRACMCALRFCVGTLVHVHQCQCNLVSTYAWVLCPVKRKTGVCQVKRTHCQLCQVCISVYVCVTVCLRARKQVIVIENCGSNCLFSAKRHL